MAPQKETLLPRVTRISWDSAAFALPRGGLAANATPRPRRKGKGKGKRGKGKGKRAAAALAARGSTRSPFVPGLAAGPPSRPATAPARRPASARARPTPRSGAQSRPGSASAVTLAEPLTTADVAQRADKDGAPVTIRRLVDENRSEGRPEDPRRGPESPRSRPQSARAALAAARVPGTSALVVDGGDPRWDAQAASPEADTRQVYEPKLAPATPTEGVRVHRFRIPSPAVDEEARGDGHMSHAFVPPLDFDALDDDAASGDDDVVDVDDDDDVDDEGDGDSQLDQVLDAYENDRAAKRLDFGARPTSAARRGPVADSRPPRPQSALSTVGAAAKRELPRQQFTVFPAHAPGKSHTPKTNVVLAVPEPVDPGRERPIEPHGGDGGSGAGEDDPWQAYAHVVERAMEDEPVVTLPSQEPYDADEADDGNASEDERMAPEDFRALPSGLFSHENAYRPARMATTASTYGTRTDRDRPQTARAVMVRKGTGTGGRPVSASERPAAAAAALASDLGQPSGLAVATLDLSVLGEDKVSREFDSRQFAARPVCSPRQRPSTAGPRRRPASARSMASSGGYDDAAAFVVDDVDDSPAAVDQEDGGGARARAHRPHSAAAAVGRPTSAASSEAQSLLNYRTRGWLDLYTRRVTRQHETEQRAREAKRNGRTRPASARARLASAPQRREYAPSKLNRSIVPELSTSNRPAPTSEAALLPTVDIMMPGTRSTPGAQASRDNGAFIDEWVAAAAQTTDNQQRAPAPSRPSSAFPQYGASAPRRRPWSAVRPAGGMRVAQPQSPRTATVTKVAFGEALDLPFHPDEASMNRNVWNPVRDPVDAAIVDA